MIHVGSDPLMTPYPLRGFPTDMAITGLSGADARGACDRAPWQNSAAARIDSRRKRLADDRQRQRERWKADLEKAKCPRQRRHLTRYGLTHCLNRGEAAPDDIIVKESPTAWVDAAPT